MLLPIKDGTQMRSFGTKCKSPEMIMHGLGRYCGYSGVMTSWCQSGVVPGGSPLHGWFQVVPIPSRRCLSHNN